MFLCDEKIAGKTWKIFLDMNKFLYSDKLKNFHNKQGKSSLSAKIISLENERVYLEMKNLLLMIAQMKLLSQHVFPLFLFRCFAFHMSIYQTFS